MAAAEEAAVRRTYSFTFNGNGTGVIVEQYNDSYSGIETETETFSYVLTGENKGTITIRVYDSYSGYSTEVEYFEIQNNQMTISEDEQGRYPWITLSKAGAPNTNNVVGTWKGGKGRYNYTFTFNAGGTGSFVEQYYDSYSGTETDTETFNYSLTGNNNGTITMRIYDSYSGYSTEVFYFYIENNTGKNIGVQANDMSINGFMVTPYFSATVYDGKMALDDITIMQSDLDKNEIKSIDDIELKFHLFDANSYATIKDTDTIAFSTK